jgi:hypothetical protein
MSDFVDRLEDELLSSGKRYFSRRTRSRTPIAAVPILLSIAVTLAVVAVILSSGGTRSHPHASSAKPPQIPAVGSQNITASNAPGCRFKATRKDAMVLPPLVQSEAAPGALVSLVGLLRTPATAGDRIDLKQFNRAPWIVLSVYVRYIRVVDGPLGARIALVPARICGEVLSSPNARPVQVAPHDVLLMQALSNPPSRRGTVYVGTPADIRSGAADPSLATSGAPRTSVKLTIVPDGVARVVFSYPGHQPSSATATIHDNVGISSPVPASMPSTTTWYANNGSIVRTFTSATRPAARPTRSRATERTQECRAAQVRFQSPAHVDGLLGTGVVHIVITNTGSRPCAISGYPRVQLLNAHRRPVAIKVIHGTLAPKEPVRVSTVVLAQTRGRATFGVSFADHPGPAPASDCRKFYFIRAILPGQRTALTTATEIPAQVCGGRPNPSLYVSPIGPQ